MDQIARINYIIARFPGWKRVLTVGEKWILQDNGLKSFVAYMKDKRENLVQEL